MSLELADEMTMRCAMIGTDRVRGHMARALKDTTGVQSHGVPSQVLDTARNFAEEHGISRTYLSLGSLLLDPGNEYEDTRSGNSLSYLRSTHG